MHDIDRVLLESEELEDESELEASFGGELEDEDFLGELEHELEDELEDEDELEGELELEIHEAGEQQELELTSHLLEVQGEQELEQFIGDLLRSTADTAGRFARSKTGRQLGGILKQAALKSLPVIGAGIGGSVGGAKGERLGRALGKAGQCFGLQFEGLSNEDKEFELARQFVRFANCASRHAQRKAMAGPPRQVAQHAIRHAAHRHAPGLQLERILTAAPLRRAATPLTSAPATVVRRTTTVVPSGTAGPPPDGPLCVRCAHRALGDGGRWVKRGKAVVLLPR